MKPSDNYLKIVGWSKEDACYIGSCPTVIHGGIHGDDEMKVYKELCIAVDEALELAKNDKRKLPKPDVEKYSGKFIVRTDPAVHGKLALKAKLRGESLNQYINKLLEKA